MAIPPTGAHSTSKSRPDERRWRARTRRSWGSWIHHDTLRDCAAIPPAATPSSCSGDVWGRLSRWQFSPDGRGPFARREIGTFDEFSSRQLVLSSTNQKRSNPRADAESKVCVLLTFLSGGSVRRRHSPAHLHTSTKQALRRISTRRSSRKRSQAYVTFPRVQHRLEALAKTKKRTGTYRVSPLKNKIARCRTLSTPFARRRRTDSSSSSRRNTFKPTW